VSLHCSRVILYSSRTSLHGSRVSLLGSKMSLHSSRMTLLGFRMKNHVKIQQCIFSILAHPCQHRGDLYNYIKKCTLVIQNSKTKNTPSLTLNMSNILKIRKETFFLSCPHLMGSPSIIKDEITINQSMTVDSQ
jgi:hypothetical protein